jgi:hypothetical protein
MSRLLAEYHEELLKTEEEDKKTLPKSLLLLK